jgi:hypothetical protein
MRSGGGRKAAAAGGLLIVALLGSACWNDRSSAPEDQPPAAAAASRRAEAQIMRDGAPLPPPYGAVSHVRCEVRLLHGGPGGPYWDCHANVTVDGLTTKDVHMQFDSGPEPDYALGAPLCCGALERTSPFCRGSG